MAGSALIIGSGFAGLSAASFLAKVGWEVTVLEKNDTPGGRASQLKEQGFEFDMGPSWYWMPDVFERYFAAFGKEVRDYYQLQRLDPSYRVYWNEGFSDIPAGYEELKSLFESIEPGSGIQLDHFLKEAAFKYDIGVGKLVYKPGLSFTEFLDWEMIKGVFRLDVFTSIEKHIAKYFKNEKLRRLLEFPVLFLGALPRNTPALYSLMNYADIKGGTWYPAGGMYAVVQGMYKLAIELGVNFHFNEDVQEIMMENTEAKKVRTATNLFEAEVVVSTADYHFTETQLIPASLQSYSAAYWDQRVMAPSCLLYYIGLDKKLTGVRHHSLFFDVPFAAHAEQIYSKPGWPTEPLFYVSANSVTDPTVAPAGAENLVFLVPVAAGLENDSEELRQKYLELILARMEDHTGQKIKAHIVYKKTFSVSDFVDRYNSFRGNAYGLANTLSQTAIFRPSCRSRKVSNLFYAGQLTVPGPGVPPAIISGEVVAAEVIKSFR